MFGRKKHISDEIELLNAAEQLKKGSAEAFHILYNNYSKAVYRYCLRMLSDEDSARDAFQDTFIKVFEHRREFRGTNFAAWLFTIARHTCLNVIRSRKDFENIENLGVELVTSEVGDLAMKEHIRKAVQSLPLALREALILREYEEYSYREIADILKIDLSLAKVRVHRARLLLRKILTPLVKEYYES